MPAACENLSLRAELERVKTRLKDSIESSVLLRYKLMEHICHSTVNNWCEIYGLGDEVVGDGDNYGVPRCGIDDFRVNIINSSRETQHEYRVLKFEECPIPTEADMRKVFRWYGANHGGLIVKILTAEERAVELAPFDRGEDDGAWERPEFIPCMNFMIDRVENQHI